jgi:predicted Zn-dependent peptidase
VRFERSRVDEVPVFWTESGDEMLAGLVFRVGRADESLARGGITHMIEHLALYPLGADAGRHYNGQVDAVTTTFVRRGRPEEITGFFRAVCANLRELPTGRLEGERQVLRTEADGRQAGTTGLPFIERYGADTYGLPYYPEYGISAIQAPDLKPWSDRYFTRGNAALWIAGGPPPDGLALDLPGGPAVPAPRPAGQPPRTPAYANAPVRGVAWSALVGRSPAAQAYAAILDRRLRRELRHEQALAYSPSVGYAFRDEQLAHVLAVVDGLPEVRSLLVSAFIREVERLEEKDVSEDELRSAIDSLGPNTGTARGAAQWVTSAARNAIMGRPVRSVAAWEESLAAVSVAQVREVAREAMASSLFVLPQGSVPHRPFTWLSGCSDTAVAGHRIRSADSPLDPARLVVGADGVSLVRGQAITTVRAAECAALLRWSDGARQFIGRDGAVIRVEPGLWRLKNQASRLDAMVPADRQVAMPYRDQATAPRPWTSRPTRAAGWLLMQPVPSVITGVVPVMAVLVVLAIVAPPDGTVTAALLVFGLALGVSAAQFARTRLLIRAAQQNSRRY